MAKMESFDSSAYTDMDNFEAMPAGKYPMKIVSSKNCITRDTKGGYLKIELEIMQGEFQGRKVWTNINLKNRSKECVRNARKELATICRACNKPVIQDSDELIGIPMTVKIKVNPPKGDYPASNSPTAYSALTQAISDPADEDPDIPDEQEIAEANAASESDEAPGWEVVDDNGTLL